MSWTSFLLSYLLGGVTFLPLVIAAILLHAYLTFPHRPDATLSPPSEEGPDDLVQAGDDLGPLKAAQASQKEDRAAPVQHHEPDVAAGYFAVCREYTPMGINAKPIERSTPVGSTTVAAPSPSVYQTMYRSIFDRKQASGPLDNNAKGGLNPRPKKAGNVFYVVLRHGHLMLFDDDEQLEVRHVISLAHHNISIYSGGDLTPEGELFIKRNALCLSRKTHGSEVGPDTQITKPFYLFSENCSAKEDFYFALLRNQQQTFAIDHGDTAPLPVQFDVGNIISLVQKLHSSEEHLQTRWLNGLIGRIFLGVHSTKDLEYYIRAKITKKISRVKRPSFLSGISIRKIDTGDSAPYFTNPRLKDLTVEGECGVEADVRYTGNFRIEVAAKARIDLGSRFKVREVDLVLAVMIRKLEGHILFKIKAPPSNRIWFSFQQMPKMEMAIEPIVSSRQITYTVILRQIEHRIKEVIGESIVLPFWDDVPFFRTEHKRWRGGIFEGDDYVVPSAELEEAAAAIGKVDDVDRMEEERVSGGSESPDLLPMEKSHSVPVLENTAPTGFFGRRRGKGTDSPRASALALSTSLDASQDSSHGSTPNLPGRPLRSPSVASASSANTGTDTAKNVEDVMPLPSPPDHGMDIPSGRPQGNTTPPTQTLLGSSARQSAFSKSSSQNNSSASSREATDNEKDTERRPSAPDQRKGSTPSLDEKVLDDASSAASIPLSSKGSVRSQTGNLARGLFARRDNLSGPSSPRLADGSNTPDGQKRTALAAVSNAAGAARRWGLNALQRHNEGNGLGINSNNSSKRHLGPGEADSPVDYSQPMGRGQPLPPPGVPLPGPDRRSRGGPMPAPLSHKRPLAMPPPLPARNTTTSTTSEQQDHSASQAERRPVPPPPLPKRRQISVSEPADLDPDNMLVIAAPSDSAPGSPTTEDAPPVAYVQPWVQDEDDEEALGEQHEPEPDAAFEGAGDDHAHPQAVESGVSHLATAEQDQPVDTVAEKDEGGAIEETPTEKQHDEPAQEEEPEAPHPHRPDDLHDEEKLALHVPEETHHPERSFHDDNDDDEDLSAWMDEGVQRPTPAEALVTSEGMAQ